VNTSPRATAIIIACSTSAVGVGAAPGAERARNRDDMPPPMAPADIICISMTAGNTRETPASASVPSRPNKISFDQPDGRLVQPSPAHWAPPA